MAVFQFNTGTGGFGGGNFTNDGVNLDAEFEKICVSHPGCEGCPLKTEDKNYGNVKLTCITGRSKR